MGSCLISFISVLISLLIPISIFVSISILMADMPYGNWKMFLRDSSAVNIDPLLTNSTVYHLTIVTFCKPKQRINPDPVESGSFSGSGVFCFRSGSELVPVLIKQKFNELFTINKFNDILILFPFLAV